MTRDWQEEIKGDRQELYLLYQNATANLAELKKSQWQVLVLFSAIIAFLITQTKGLSSPIKVFLSLALFAGVISTIVMLEQYWKKIDQERNVLNNIYKCFGQEFRDCRKPKGEVRQRDCFEHFFRWGGYAYLVVIFLIAMAAFWYPFRCAL